MKNKGHDVLSFHLDLNPTELVWTDIKGYVTSRHVSCTISQSEMLCKEKVLRVGPNDWIRKCRDVEKLEYLVQELVIDNIAESLTMSSNSK